MKEYKILYHIADLCDANNGWKKELNVVQINKNPDAIGGGYACLFFC